MARILSIGGRAPERLEAGWRLALTASGACAGPAEAALLDDWIPALVPGTVAGALQAAGRWQVGAPEPLNDKDVWYRCRLQGGGPAILRFEGLATLSEVWLGERRILGPDSMFLAHETPVEIEDGDELWLCFRALAQRLAQKGPRARWRPRMIIPQGVRLVRTTLLGHMPGWCPPVDAVGPWRPVLRLPATGVRVTAADVRAELDPDGTGRIVASVAIEGEVGSVVLSCAGRSVRLARSDAGRFEGVLELPGVEPWWPHTHGAQPLYEVTLDLDGVSHDLGRTGFRRIEVDCGGDGQGFGLKVNDLPVFCRGACWTSADLAGLSGARETYEPVLRLAREAGMNMLRIGGTGVYETPEFFRLCDELGVLVWQDFMFANFDYPTADPAFVDSVAREADQMLDAIQLSPSLVVLCGGSEVQQQAAMLGLPPQAWTSSLFDDLLPSIARRRRPEAVYVPNSPSGGAPPFSPNAGVSHYYGVGAYRRPLDDARRAEVRFASECLAFANLPQPESPAFGENETWGAGVPRDVGADWDFSDVRDHYLAMLYDADPARLRAEDPGRYLDLSRAVSGEVMEAVFAEWRRARSTCRGGLVWTLQDLASGSGWGVIDAEGEPKPAWYALKRAFRPVQVALTDEGCNGLAVHLHNETAAAIEAVLTLRCLREGEIAVASAERVLTLPPRSSQELSGFDVIGGFFDLAYAYRFGPPSHDVVHAELACAATGEMLAQAFHFPVGRPAALRPATITAELARDGEDWILGLSTDRLAQSVHIQDASFRPQDDGFHLAPGRPRKVRLLRRSGADPDARPTGQVRSLGDPAAVGYAAAD